MTLSTACPKPRSRFLDKLEKAESKAVNAREVYAAVDARDGWCCRVCGKFSNVRAVGVLHKGHHHHIVYRSAGGQDETSNLCLLCPRCHDEEHAHRLRISGDADERDVMGKLCGLTIEVERESGWTVLKVG
jgi:5-methylcytosine-specific restriction endonuclease McrA